MGHRSRRRTNEGKYETFDGACDGRHGGETATADGKCVRACIGGLYILASPSYIEVRRTG